MYHFFVIIIHTITGQPRQPIHDRHIILLRCIITITPINNIGGRKTIGQEETEGHVGFGRHGLMIDTIVGPFTYAVLGFNGVGSHAWTLVEVDDRWDCEFVIFFIPTYWSPPPSYAHNFTNHFELQSWPRRNVY